MKIAVVCPYDLARAGGVQQLTVELVDRLTAAGHEAWLVGPGERAGARTVGRTLTVRANASAVPVALGPMVASRTRRAIAEADVVHIHEPLIPLVGISALTTARPKVLTFHADAPRWVGRGYRLLSQPLRRPMTSAIVTAVSPVAAAVLPAAWGPAEIIPNALDVGRYRSDEPRNPRRVTFLGRDDPRKGLDLLLAAWPAVLAAVEDAELVAMGATRGTAPPNVTYAGRVSEDEKRRLLASAGIHVAPNTGGESFGIVVAEAMAAGCAVVASDLPAFTEVMDGSGIHVPVGDVAALSEAIIALLLDPARARRAGDAARVRAGDFDWSAVTDRYLSAYQRAIG